MPTAHENVLTRDDTFLGICEAIGEDFRFNPFFLRVGLGVLLLFNPLAALGGYAAAGLIVGLSRLLAPNPRPAFAGADAHLLPISAGANDRNAETLAAAA